MPRSTAPTAGRGAKVAARVSRPSATTAAPTQRRAVPHPVPITSETVFRKPAPSDWSHSITPFADLGRETITYVAKAEQLTFGAVTTWARLARRLPAPFPWPTGLPSRVKATSELEASFRLAGEMLALQRNFVFRLVDIMMPSTGRNRPAAA